MTETAAKTASLGQAVGSPEFQAVRLCARTDLAETDQNHLADLIADTLDWGEVLRLAGYHQVAPLVLHNLERYASGAVPQPCLRVLQAEGHRVGVQGKFLLQELGRLMRCFEAAGIPMMVLKGPVVAQVAYGHLSLRPFKDIDILVRPDDYPAVRDLLDSEGYIPFPQITERSSWRRLLHRWYVRQVPFMRGIKTFYVDLHLAPLPSLYHFPLEVDDLLTRGYTEQIGAYEVLVPRIEDHLLMLCYHGEKNRWERLKYLCDVAELIRRHGAALDWRYVEATARRIRGTRIVGVALWLAHELLAAPVPSSMLEAVLDTRVVQDLGIDLIQRLADQHRAGLLPFKERVALHLQMQESLLNKIRYGFFSMVRTMA